MRLGQVEQLFDARAEADAEPLAAAERDQRVRQLVALAQRIRPRIEKAGEALQSIRRDADHQPQRDRQQEPEADEQAPVEAAEKQDAERDGDDHHAGAEVGLVQQQRADADHHREQRQEAASAASA